MDGSTEKTTRGKRNGRVVAIFPPASGNPPDRNEPTGPPPFWEQSKLFVNLNDTEARTWTLILRGVSISEIARQENVSRQAIYARIEGNQKDQGGMIGKNFWVLLWWLMRSVGREHK